MRFKRIAAMAVIGALALTGAACGSDEPSPGTSSAAAPTFAAGTTMAKLNQAQKIIIGTKFDQPLFGQKGLDGKPAGFDVEIGKIIASELGIPADKVEFIESKSAVREELIVQGKADIVVATYTINDARKEKISFAGPYYVAGQDILVRKDDSSITGPESFKDGTKKVCSVTGSTPAKKIVEYLKDPTKPESQLVLFGGYADCVEALKTKTVDAVTTDNVILLGFADAEPDAVKVLAKPFTKEPYVARSDKHIVRCLGEVAVVLPVHEEKIYSDGRYKKAWEDTVGDVAPLVAGPAVNRY